MMINFVFQEILDGSRKAVRESIPGIPGSPSPRSHPKDVVFAYDGLTIEL